LLNRLVIVFETLLSDVLQLYLVCLCGTLVNVNTLAIVVDAGKNRVIVLVSRYLFFWLLSLRALNQSVLLLDWKRDCVLCSLERAFFWTSVLIMAKSPIPDSLHILHYRSFS